MNMPIYEIKKTFSTYTKTIEILLLLHNIKKVVRQGFYNFEKDKVIEFCKKNNIFYSESPYKVIFVNPELKNYSNKGLKVKKEDKRTGIQFFYFSKNEKEAYLANYYETINDDLNLGLILEYPDCCIKNFIKNKNEMAKLDNDFINLTAKNSKNKKHKFYTNINQRNKDRVLLSHFPCCFECEKSIKLGEQYLNSLKKNILK